LYYKDLSPDNNPSEQAIRSAKFKMKMSSRCRGLQQQFAILRSMVDTMIKYKLNILETLSTLEQGKQLNFRYI